MNNVAGAVLLCLVMLGPLVGYGAYLILRRLKHGGRIGAALVALFVVPAVLFGAEVLMGGTIASGVVVKKSDTVQLARLELIPRVIHILRVQVRESGKEGGDNTLTLALDPGRFDHLREGQAVDLRQTGLGPIRFARLADGPGWAQLPFLELRGLGALAAIAVTLLAVGLCFLATIMRRRGPILAAAMVAIALALGLDAAATWPWWMPRPIGGSARVIDIRTVRQALIGYGSHPRRSKLVTLPTPYDEVTLQLTPSPGADPVLVIDRIDQGSGGDLVIGGAASVAYAMSSPRDARLRQGTRTYATNAYASRLGGMAVDVGLGVLVLLGIVAALSRLRRRRPHAEVLPG